MRRFFCHTPPLHRRIYVQQQVPELVTAHGHLLFSQHTALRRTGVALGGWTALMTAGLPSAKPIMLLLTGTNVLLLPLN